MTRAILTPKSTRRQFIKQTSSLAAGASVLSGVLPHVHAADDQTIRLALIGCGSRGSGAVGDAFGVKDYGPVKLYAPTDLDEARMTKACDALKKKHEDKIDVADDRKFPGFDSYKKAIDILRPGDIATRTTRAYIRPVHVEYAVKKGINVFMEKPFAPDPMGLKRLLRAGEEAEKKGVKIAAGFQRRHSPARQALIQQIRDGVPGEIPKDRNFDSGRVTVRRWFAACSTPLNTPSPMAPRRSAGSTGSTRPAATSPPTSTAPSAPRSSPATSTPRPSTASRTSGPMRTTSCGPRRRTPSARGNTNGTTSSPAFATTARTTSASAPAIPTSPRSWAARPATWAR